MAKLKAFRLRSSYHSWLRMVESCYYSDISLQRPFYGRLLFLAVILVDLGMPHRKDYLLDQLRDFFEALNRVAARIQEGELDKAEQEIDALASGAAIGELLHAGEGDLTAEHVYAGWKFQTQLLLLRIRVMEARGLDAGVQRAPALEVLRKLIALRPDVYDLELQE